MSTIEQQTSQTVLQQPTGKITIGDTEYPIPRPTVGTLIMVSEITSTLPQPKVLKSETFLADILSMAKDTKPLGRIVAVLLLGAERVITEESKVRKKPSKWRFWKRKQRNVVDEIADKVLNTLSPSEMNAVIGKLFDTLQLGHFFGLTTSLKTQNILASTKSGVATNPTTVSGL